MIVEPIYIDLKHPIEGSGVIEDDNIALIYGAIKKYGALKAAIIELKEFIKLNVQ